ncbi:MAG TPA: type VI secretion system tip protein TssI/VgrG [Polyangia bacterium]
MPPAHHLTVSGPFEEGDEVIVERLAGRESLGSIFQLDLTLLSRSPTLDMGKIVGDKLTVVLADEDSKRYFNGFVTRMSRAGTFDRYARYRVTLHPWFHLLGARINSRIFQHKNVVDIAKKIFGEHGFTDITDATTETYPVREYVVQYGESDFNFVSRLFENAGIYYYFKHEAKRHVLVIADSPSAHAEVPGFEKVPFHPEGATSPDSPPCVNVWEPAQQWRSGAYTSDDFDFTRPKAELMSKLTVSSPHHKHGTMEVYDYPGGYQETKIGQSYVRARLEALQSDVETVGGAGNVHALAAGDVFALTGFPNQAEDKSYLIVSSSFEVVNNVVQTSGRGSALALEGGDFRWTFTAIDDTVPYRPARSTPRPRIEGVQTAIVVGVSGEEITTDKYGRVKVQFHWDREGQRDENTSCWIRVAQIWAGTQWGGIHIPRIGQEVLVDFLEGDPDRPVITGRLYNGDNMPPYALPGNQTQSGIKSRSSKGGNPGNFNELRFEDKKGSEEIYLQAEKDLDALIKHDETRHVDHDRETRIANDETVHVGHDRTETVASDETISIGASRTETVGSNETVTVGGSRTLTVAMQEQTTVGAARAVTVGGNESRTIGSNENLTVGGALVVEIGRDDKLTVGGKRTVSIAKEEIIEVGSKLSINVKDEISITTGDATISMKKNGDITIKGKNITIEGSGKVNVKATGDVIVKGSKIAKN